jgi:glycosyltransferase involved in cell wall biosynthesis
MITLLLFIIILFATLQWIVVLINIIFKVKLPKSEYKEDDLISVLIPARNEQRNIQLILKDLINQKYKNLEIIICNDDSEDETKAIVQSFISQDSRIQLFDSLPLPEGWLGKNWACHQLAEKAHGSHFLFIDADVRLGNEIIEETITYHKNEKIGLLSVFPIQKMDTIGEYLTVPLMHYILLTLLPLVFVKKSHFASLAAANGQFMLFDQTIYNTYHPHSLVKSNKVEDIKIAQIFKKKGIRIACLTGINGIQCRMYHDLKSGIDGFSKNMVSFLGNSYILAFLFWTFTTCSIVIISVYGTINILLIYLFLYIFTKILVSLIAKQNFIYNLLLSIPQHIIMLIIIIKSYIHSKTKKQLWKGRSIS